MAKGVHPHDTLQDETSDVLEGTQRTLVRQVRLTVTVLAGPVALASARVIEDAVGARALVLTRVRQTVVDVLH